MAEKNTIEPQELRDVTPEFSNTPKTSDRYQEILFQKLPPPTEITEKDWKDIYPVLLLPEVQKSFDDKNTPEDIGFKLAVANSWLNYEAKVKEDVVQTINDYHMTIEGHPYTSSDGKTLQDYLIPLIIGAVQEAGYEGSGAKIYDASIKMCSEIGIKASYENLETCMRLIIEKLGNNRIDTAEERLNVGAESIDPIRENSVAKKTMEDSILVQMQASEPLDPNKFENAIKEFSGESKKVFVDSLRNYALKQKEVREKYNNREIDESKAIESSLEARAVLPRDTYQRNMILEMYEASTSSAKERNVFEKRLSDPKEYAKFINQQDSKYRSRFGKYGLMEAAAVGSAFYSVIEHVSSQSSNLPSEKILEYASAALASFLVYNSVQRMDQQVEYASSNFSEAKADDENSGYEQNIRRIVSIKNLVSKASKLNPVGSVSPRYPKSNPSFYPSNKFNSIIRPPYGNPRSGYKNADLNVGNTFPSDKGTTISWAIRSLGRTLMIGDISNNAYSFFGLPKLRWGDNYQGTPLELAFTLGLSGALAASEVRAKTYFVKNQRIKNVGEPYLINNNYFIRVSESINEQDLQEIGGKNLFMRDIYGNIFNGAQEGKRQEFIDHFNEMMFGGYRKKNDVHVVPVPGSANFKEIIDPRIVLKKVILRKENGQTNYYIEDPKYQELKKKNFNIHRYTANFDANTNQWFITLKNGNRENLSHFATPLKAGPNNIYAPDTSPKKIYVETVFDANGNPIKYKSLSKDAFKTKKQQYSNNRFLLVNDKRSNQEINPFYEVKDEQGNTHKIYNSDSYLASNNWSHMKFLYDELKNEYKLITVDHPSAYEVRGNSSLLEWSLRYLPEIPGVGNLLFGSINRGKHDKKIKDNEYTMGEADHTDLETLNRRPIKLFNSLEEYDKSFAAIFTLPEKVKVYYDINDNIVENPDLSNPQKYRVEEKIRAHFRQIDPTSPKSYFKNYETTDGLLVKIIVPTKFGAETREGILPQQANLTMRQSDLKRTENADGTFSYNMGSLGYISNISLSNSRHSPYVFKLPTELAQDTSGNNTAGVLWRTIFIGDKTKTRQGDVAPRTDIIEQEGSNLPWLLNAAVPSYALLGDGTSMRNVVERSGKELQTLINNVKFLEQINAASDPIQIEKAAIGNTFEQIVYTFGRLGLGLLGAENPEIVWDTLIANQVLKWVGGKGIEEAMVDLHLPINFGLARIPDDNILKKNLVVTAIEKAKTHKRGAIAGGALAAAGFVAALLVGQAVAGSKPVQDIPKTAKSVVDTVSKNLDQATTFTVKEGPIDFSTQGYTETLINAVTGYYNQTQFGIENSQPKTDTNQVINPIAQMNSAGGAAESASSDIAALPAQNKFKKPLSNYSSNQEFTRDYNQLLNSQTDNERNHLLFHYLSNVQIGEKGEFFVPKNASDQQLQEAADSINQNISDPFSPFNTNSSAAAVLYLQSDSNYRKTLVSLSGDTRLRNILVILHNKSNGTSSQGISKDDLSYIIKILG